MIKLMRGIGRLSATAAMVLAAAGTVHGQDGMLRRDPAAGGGWADLGGTRSTAEYVDAMPAGDLPEGFPGTADEGLAAEVGPAVPSDLEDASLSSAVACDDGICPGYKTSCRGCERCAATPYGAINRLIDKKHACWAARADALILWRDAPPDQPLVDSAATFSQVLNANSMQSAPAAGPRVSLFRGNPCTGDAWEITYLRAANFRSQRLLPDTGNGYSLSPPGIYGNPVAVPSHQTFDSGYANLGASLQSFELNHHLCHGPHIRWLAGFRWVEWQEQFTLQNTFTTGGFTDTYQTGCVNDLYGGQIGADLYLLSLPWLRLDSVIKAGAYYNTAVQNSLFTTTDAAQPAATASSHVAQTPASCAFVGELGFTGIMPVTRNIDIRLGYFGLWLSGLAQPTQQLSGQQLSLSGASSGSLSTRGGTLAQGVSIGLEGRW